SSGLIAAVSRVPAAVFEEAELNALLSDLQRLAPLAVRHEQTIRALLPAAPALIPMAFGAVYRSPERVRSLLRAEAQTFRRLLSELRHKEEWGLKVFQDTARVREVAEGESAELRRLDRQAAEAGPGRAFLLGKRRDQLVAKESERLVDRALRTILERLAAASAAVYRDEIPLEQPADERL